MNPIGLSAKRQELQQYCQQIDFLQGKGRAEAKRRKLYFQLLWRVRRIRKRLPRDLESVRQNLEARTDLVPSRRLMSQEVLGLIAEDLSALEQAVQACEMRMAHIITQKVPAIGI